MNNETEILRQIANEFKDLAAKYDYDFSIKDRAEDVKPLNDPGTSSELLNTIDFCIPFERK